MKIKQLNFVDGRAETPFGVYRILGSRGKWSWLFRDDLTGIYRTKKEAQAAAQADFERRVKECFERSDDGKD